MRRVIFIVKLLILIFVIVSCLIFILLSPRDRSTLFKKSDSITFDAKKRTYIVSRPRSKKAVTKLVVALHGFGGNGRQLAYFTGLHNSVDDQTVVIYPDALDKGATDFKPGWNAGFCCGTGWESKTDDVGFLSELIKVESLRLNLANDSVYIAGFSNGAFMSQKLAVDNPSAVKAIAVASGTIGTKTNSLTPKSSVPILLMHGKKDAVVPYAGGIAFGRPDFDWLSHDTTISRWKFANNCFDTYSEYISIGRAIKTYNKCSAPLITIEYENDGHKWHDWRILNFWHKKPQASTDIINFFTNI